MKPIKQLPTEVEIRQRALEIFLARGGRPGDRAGGSIDFVRPADARPHFTRSGQPRRSGPAAPAHAPQAEPAYAGLPGGRGLGPIPGAGQAPGDAG